MVWARQLFEPQFPPLESARVPADDRQVFRNSEGLQITLVKGSCAGVIPKQPTLEGACLCVCVLWLSSAPSPDLDSEPGSQCPSSTCLVRGKLWSWKAEGCSLMRVHTGQVHLPGNPGSFSIVYLQQECVPVAFDRCPSIFFFIRMTKDSLFACLKSTAVH